MVIVRVPDQDEVPWSPVDLVCVIDCSESMTGEKMRLVKRTLRWVVGELKDQDRISLIAFNHNAVKLLGLVRAGPQNEARLLEAIESMQASGGTFIDAGLRLAY